MQILFRENVWIVPRGENLARKQKPLETGLGLPTVDPPCVEKRVVRGEASTAGPATGGSAAAGGRHRITAAAAPRQIKACAARLSAQSNKHGMT